MSIASILIAAPPMVSPGLRHGHPHEHSLLLARAPAHQLLDAPPPPKLPPPPEKPPPPLPPLLQPPPEPDPPPAAGEADEMRMLSLEVLAPGLEPTPEHGEEKDPRAAGHDAPVRRHDEGRERRIERHQEDVEEPPHRA